MGEAEHRVGRVLCVSGSQVVMAVETAPDDATAEARSHDRLNKGDLVKMCLPETTVFGILSGLSIPVPAVGMGGEETRLGELELLGETRADGEAAAKFRRGISAFPALGDPVLRVTADDLAQIYAPSARSTVRIGTVHLNHRQPVLIAPNDLLGKHFAILGTTGCGKSCAVSLILHGILAEHQNAHIVVLDPHDEYTKAFEGVAEAIGPDNLQLPYWLLTSEEIASVIVGPKSTAKHGGAAVAILHELIPIAKAAFHREASELPITVDTPIPYRLTDVMKLLDDAMGRLDKPESLTPYRWLKARLDVLSTDARFAFMFGGIAVHDTLTRILSRLFRIPVDGKPITIIDLSGVPSEVLNVVVSVLCRMTFDFALWSRGAQPILLVCEEAHRYAPADPALGFEPTKEALARIAKEGRKYGVSLGMVSQRPSEVAPTILSQCNTTFAFRMTSLRDQEIVRGLTTDGAYGLLDFLPSLGDGEAIAAGEGVALPLRVRFDLLPPARQPRSGTAHFSNTWQSASLDESFVAEVVDRWRRQQR